MSHLDGSDIGSHTERSRSSIDLNNATIGVDDADSDKTDPKFEKQLFIRKLTKTEGCFESPIDICITHSKKLELPPLQWVNFDVPPKKVKVTNTGQTIIFSAKWGQERPYICDGPFFEKYVFSNWHLHWGSNDMEGSEHSVDGVKYPAEMHVVMFKSSYLTQEAALKEQDGCATLVYFFKLQDASNPAFQVIVDALLEIPMAGLSKKIEPKVVTNLIRKFSSDYFMYWGSVSTEKCVHYILWLITRIPIGASSEQIDSLRYIFDANGDLLTRNFRQLQTLNNRSVFHVSPSSSQYSTLLPLSDPSDVNQIYRCEIIYTTEDLNIEEDTDEESLQCPSVIDTGQQTTKTRKQVLNKLDLLNYIFG